MLRPKRITLLLHPPRKTQLPQNGILPLPHSCFRTPLLHPQNRIFTNAFPNVISSPFISSNYSRFLVGSNPSRRTNPAIKVIAGFSLCFNRRSHFRMVKIFSFLMIETPNKRLFIFNFTNSFTNEDPPLKSGGSFAIIMYFLLARQSHTISHLWLAQSSKMALKSRNIAQSFRPA